MPGTMKIFLIFVSLWHFPPKVCTTHLVHYIMLSQVPVIVPRLLQNPKPKNVPLKLSQEISAYPVDGFLGTVHAQRRSSSQRISLPLSSFGGYPFMYVHRRGSASLYCTFVAWCRLVPGTKNVLPVLLNCLKGPEIVGYACTSTILWIGPLVDKSVKFEGGGLVGLMSTRTPILYY